MVKAWRTPQRPALGMGGRALLQPDVLVSRPTVRGGMAVPVGGVAMGVLFDELPLASEAMGACALLRHAVVVVSTATVEA